MLFCLLYKWNQNIRPIVPGEESETWFIPLPEGLAGEWERWNIRRIRYNEKRFMQVCNGLQQIPLSKTDTIENVMTLGILPRYL